MLKLSLVHIIKFLYLVSGDPEDDYLKPTLSCGPVITSCGHAMHVKCYQNLFDNLVRSEQSRMAQSLMRNLLNYDVNKNEFLCPMCERLSNIVLPVTNSIENHFTLAKANSQSFFNWTERMKKIAKNKTLEGNSN